jgi:hypothetical protein
MDALPEAYVVSEGDLDRNVKILQLLDGTTQTFLQSSGSSNPKKSYPGLYYPITHVGVKADGTPWYGKIISVPTASRPRLNPVYCNESTCIKPMTVLKWQYELMRDFVVAHDKPLWDSLFDPYGSRQGTPEEVAAKRKKLFKLSAWLHHFNEMLEQYFATEAQLVCSCCLSQHSIWDTKFYPMKQFLLVRHEGAEAYYQAAAELEPSEQINDTQLKTRMEERDATIPPTAYEELPILRIEPEDDKTEIQHKSMFRNVIGPTAHLRYAPSAELVESFLEEPLFPRVFESQRQVPQSQARKPTYVTRSSSKIRKSKRLASMRMSTIRLGSKKVKRVPSKKSAKKFRLRTRLP